MTLSFVKYEGLGNDFIVVDARRWSETEAARLGPEAARRLCDRHFGIGADGVLRVEPARGPGVAAMTVLNADGSVAEMCGNGLRCVARFLRDVGAVEADAAEAVVETGAGPLPCRYVGEEVEVCLGPVHDQGHVALTVGERVVRGRQLSLGNPHFVVDDEGDRPDALALGLGLQTHPHFPGGVNVSVRRFTGEEAATLHVYERGCGLTLACGTGAGATVAAAWLEGRVTPGRAMRIRLPGGMLRLSGTLEALWLGGPARRVFEGRADWPLTTA